MIYDDCIAVDSIAFRHSDDAAVDGIDRRARRSVEVHAFVGDSIGAAVSVVTVRIRDCERRISG